MDGPRRAADDRGPGKGVRGSARRARTGGADGRKLMAPLMVGAFYNPHLGAELARATGIDHLAMADPPAPTDPHWPAIKARYTLLLHDYLGQLSEPLDERSIARARALAELYRTPWVAEHFQCLHTEDGRYNINYVFPPLYTEEFLRRFVANAKALQARLDQPLVMENIPGFFDVKASQLPEPVWLRRFFDRTGAGFLLDLPHVWLEAHYRGVKPAAWLAEFPLEQVVELHVAGVGEDQDLEGPWIAAAAPTDERIVHFFKYSRALARVTGRRPEAALQSADFDALLATTVLGSRETARAVAGLAVRHVKEGTPPPPPPPPPQLPYLNDLLRYEEAMMIAEAGPRVWRDSAHERAAGSREPSPPERVQGTALLDLAYDLPAVLPDYCSRGPR